MDPAAGQRAGSPLSVIVEGLTLRSEGVHAGERVALVSGSRAYCCLLSLPNLPVWKITASSSR